MAASTAPVPLRDDGSALLETAYTRVSRSAAFHARRGLAVVGGRVRRSGVARARLAPGAAGGGGRARAAGRACDGNDGVADAARRNAQGSRRANQLSRRP